MPAAGWTFLTNHARVLLCIARDPGVRLLDIAQRVGITERSAYGIVQDLADAGYIVKEKAGRRNRYRIRAHLPLPRTHQQGTHGRGHPGPADRRRAVGQRRRGLTAARPGRSPDGV